MSLIGVIDSGVGGLTVLQKLVNAYPYKYVYVADHAFCPYGIKSNNVLFERVSKFVNYFKLLSAQSVVLACNTISVYASRLSDIYNLPVYDVIRPTCQVVLSNPNVKSVALLATRSTLNNKAYHNILSRHNVSVVGFDCSTFVPFVESGNITSPECISAVDKALHTLPQTQVDAVILGCTHFPLMRSLIAKYCNESAIVESCCALGDTFDFATQPTVEYLTTGKVNLANTASKWCGDIAFSHLDL